MSITLSRRPDSPHWQITVKIPGRRRIRRSAGTPDKGEARALAKAIEAREWKRVTDGEAATLTFAEAVALYVGDGKSALYLERLVAWFKDRAVAQITEGDVHAAARALYGHAKPATQNRQAIIPARAVINHAARYKLAQRLHVSTFKVIKPARKAADGPWLAAFTSAAPPHFAALALFMASTAARIGQALALTWDHVDLQAARVIMPAAKGTGETAVHIPPSVVAALANLHGRAHRLRSRRRARPVFGMTKRSSVYRQWRRICTAAGIAYLPPHQAGRHAFATEMIVRRGKDVATTARLGRWASHTVLLDSYTHAEPDAAIIDDLFQEKRKA